MLTGNRLSAISSNKDFSEAVYQPSRAVLLLVVVVVVIVTVFMTLGAVYDALEISSDIEQVRDQIRGFPATKHLYKKNPGNN